MLVKRLQRHLAIFLTAAMLLPCLPVYTAAAEENPENITETSETAPVPEEPAADEPAAEAADSAIIAYYQEKIDTILDTYLNVDGLPREEFKGRLASMTAEEVRAFVADMGFEYREALYDIMLMEEELGAQFDAEEISEQQISELLETDLVYSNFVDALWEKYAADKSISWLEATPIDGVSVTDSLGNATLSTDGTKVTITAGGAAYTYGTPETNNITITNENTYSATISFDYSIDRYSAFSESPNYSGTKTQLLASGESITMSITGARNTLSSRRTATLTLSNFSCVRAAESSDVTIQFENGTVTADGSSVPTGTVISATLTSGVALAATPSSGMTFLGWIDAETHEIVSDTASFTHYPSKNITLQPVFASAATDAWFSVDNNTIISLYDDLNEAGAAAANASSKTAVLRHDGTLPSGNYTIPAGVTLLIPFDAAHTLCTTKPQTDAANSLTKPTPYRTLKMAADANITVNGAISVSGTQHSKMALGTPFGPVGYIDMASGSSITVNNGGNLYVWGFIAGSGAVTVKSGGTVYESFQVSDWRGGSATLAMQDNNEKIFPVTQYHVQNVEVPMTLEAGAYEKGFMSVNVTLAGIQTTTIDFVGPDSLFIINSGSITKDYDEATDRLIIDLNNCTLNINTVTISVRVQLVGSVTLQSSKYILPISSNITVNVNSGSSVNLSQNMAFLPGTELNIEQGATCSVTGDASIIFYDVDNWGKYCGASNLEMTYVSAVSSGTRASRATLADAAIKVNGTLDASNGYLYTTAAGGNIYSTGTGQVIQRAGTQTVTYQATYVEDGYTANSIPITPAKLKNGDGSFTDTSSATEATTYVYRNSIWCSHTDSDFTDSNKDHKCDTCGTVMSQCTDSDGDGDHTCDYCGAENVTSHTPGAAATCTTPQTCTECGTEIKAALGHSYSSQVTQAPSCTETGTKTFTCGTCGDSYTEDIPMTEHTWNGDTICDDCGIFKIYGTNLKVGDGLDIYFYVSSEVEIGSDWQVVFTRDGVDTTPSITWETTADGMHRFCYEGIAAKEMTDVVTVTIRNADGTPVSLPFKQSVENYTLQALSAYSSNTTLCTALVDMLNYGAAAQVNWNYYVERLANARLTDEQKNVGDVSAAYNTKMDDDEDVYKLFGATVSAKSTLYFTFYFDGIDPENLSSYSAKTTYTTIYGGTRSENYSGEDFEKLDYTSTENGTEITTTYYGPRVLDISTADGNMIVTCTLYVDGEPVTTVESSVESYVANAINTYDGYINENTADSLAAAQQMKPLVDMCKALKKFIDSSSTYFVSVNNAS